VNQAILSPFSCLTVIPTFRHGDPKLIEAAVTAVIRVLDKGSMVDREKLMQANVFGVALNIHKAGSDPKISSKLLSSVVSTLNHLIILDEVSFEEVLGLFE
jgi:exosome complex RNA-binding protein Rrp42 (RNase PH superfamily)